MKKFKIWYLYMKQESLNSTRKKENSNSTILAKPEQQLHPTHIKRAPHTADYSHEAFVRGEGEDVAVFAKALAMILE